MPKGHCLHCVTMVVQNTGTYQEPPLSPRMFLVLLDFTYKTHIQ